MSSNNQNFKDLLVQVQAGLNLLEQLQTNSDEDGDDKDHVDSNLKLTSNLDKIFKSDDAIDHFIKKKDFKDAFETAKQQYERLPQAYYARAVVQFYVCSMHANHPEIAVKVRDELTELLRKTTKTSGVEAENYGSWCQSKKKLFEAFLFYQIAAELFKSDNKLDAGKIISSLHHCCRGTCNLISGLLENALASKQLVESYMIPFMRKIVVNIGKHASAENGKNRKSYLTQCICLHYVEQCELEIDDYESRENTINEALRLFETKFAPDPETHSLYGSFLNNLGQNHLLQKKHQEAARLFTKAIVAKQKAKDYETEEEKKTDVEKSERGLNWARNPN